MPLLGLIINFTLTTPCFHCADKREFKEKMKKGFYVVVMVGVAYNLEALRRRPRKMWERFWSKGK